MAAACKPALKTARTKTQTTELVPVKIKYPGRPPASEPEWVHLEWIRATAAEVMHLPGCGQSLQEAIEFARRLNVKTWDDSYCQLWQARHNELWAEVVPLFQEAQAVLPLEVWSQFQHIRTPHDAVANSDAIQEWKRLRDYALDRLAKLGLAKIQETPKLQLHSNGSIFSATLNNIIYPLSEPQHAYLAKLVEADRIGGWYAPPKGSGERPGRLRGNLPEPLQSVIEAADGKGSRLSRT